MWTIIVRLLRASPALLKTLAEGKTWSSPLLVRKVYTILNEKDFSNLALCAPLRGYSCKPLAEQFHVH